MKVAKKTLRISNENIVFAIGIKVAVLILSAIGVTTMWAAIFADVGVTILAVLNSFRALNVKSV
jgi:Cd2+/Zn2+-exporting ATPase